MASSKKEPVATAAVPNEPAAAPAAPAAKPAARRAPAKAKPANTAPAKTAKPVDAAVQASQEALAKALQAAKAVKITKPLGKPAKAEKPVKAEKPAKARKAKLVRDSFTMPEAEYEQIAGLKKRLLGHGRAAKKSELLRAGIALLVALKDEDLAAALEKVEVIKTGRPAKAAK